jgi:hypothetical protein
LTEERECLACSQPFTFTRTVGKPPGFCSAECRQEGNRRRQARWFARFKEAKAELEALQAAGMA